MLRVAEMKLAMVEYTDINNPTPVTKMVAVHPGGAVYFIDEKIVGRQGQNWFCKAVLAKLSK